MSSQRPGRNDRGSGRQVLLVLMFLLVVWGAVLGCGVILNSNTTGLLKPTIFFAAPVLLSVIWICALIFRNRRQALATKTGDQKFQDRRKNGS